jgi:3-hydroxy-9,10-secoandrosta-1,3,5(10)-triene-9,17-dione monooxygenase reductase component
MSQTRTLTPVGKASFRNAMGLFATGVAVLTTAHQGRYHGVTVNSLTSVSLDPFLLLVCLSKSSVTGNAIRKRGEFMVSLLAEAQLDVSGRFVGKSEDRFSSIELNHSENGIPMPAGCVAYLACTVRTIHDGGDHRPRQKTRGLPGCSSQATTSAMMMSCSASSTGLCHGSTRTAVPTRSVFVRAASQVSKFSVAEIWDHPVK